MLSIPELKKNVYLIESNKMKIVTGWILKNVFEETIAKYDMEPNFFRDKYAVKVVDYFIDVIKGKVEIGDCPVIKTMLHDFILYHISADDLFLICAQFRKSLIDFTFNQGIASKELLDQINYVIDKNFSGVLKTYEEMLHLRD
jgi:hypothetical protein